MSEHTATIHWLRGDQPFSDRRYSRRHGVRFDGGHDMPASSSPSVVREPMSDASAVDPEEMFIASLSSCHLLWFLDLACRAGWVVDDYRDQPAGRMATDAQGRTAIVEITLRPAVRFAGDRRPSRDEVQRLHHAAHEACFIASSVKAEVRCEPVWTQTEA